MTDYLGIESPLDWEDPELNEPTESFFMTAEGYFEIAKMALNAAWDEVSKRGLTLETRRHYETLKTNAWLALAERDFDRMEAERDSRPKGGMKT